MTSSIENDIETIHSKLIDHSPVLIETVLIETVLIETVLIGTVLIGTSLLYKVIEGLGGNIGDVNTQHFHNTVEDQTN